MSRRLSAPVHLDDDFALYVDRTLTADRLNAIGLGLAIDAVALARHARVATRRRAAPDRRPACLQTAVTLALLAGLRGLVNGDRSLGRVAISGPLGACAIAWPLVRHTRARGRAMARDAFLRADSSEQTVPPVEPEAEAAPRDLNALPMRPFDVVDPHVYGARHMETISGLQGLRARSRLHVLGSNAHRIPGLVPGPWEVGACPIPPQDGRCPLRRPRDDRPGRAARARTPGRPRPHGIRPARAEAVTAIPPIRRPLRSGAGRRTASEDRT
ncbi:hypothetical protein ACWD1W_02840 [Streptomyces olivaceoviridis]